MVSSRTGMFRFSRHHIHQLSNAIGDCQIVKTGPCEMSGHFVVIRVQWKRSLYRQMENSRGLVDDLQIMF